MTRSSKSKILLSAFLFLSQQCAFALETVVPARPGASNIVRSSAARMMGLDLSSSKNTVTVTSGMMRGLESTSITVGSSQMPIFAGSQLTPAQYVAMTQVLSGAGQSLQISTTGSGMGGTLSLSSIGNSFSSLVIPANVSASHSNLGRPLTVSGLLSAAGALSAITGGSTFRILAGAVNVESTGSISTALAARPINLSISSLSNIVNAGLISSSGSLNISANRIANTGQITAARGVNITLAGPSPSLVNSGVIAAQTNNLSIATVTPVDLLINNRDGEMQALLGSINIVNGKGKAKPTTDILGGVFRSGDALNVFGSDGAINVFVDQIDGILNNTGGSAHVGVNQGTLQIGLQDLSGDPTFLNSTGDLVIGSSTVHSYSFPGQDLALLAKGNITAFTGFTGIDLSSKTGKGGNLFAIAGFNLTPAGTQSSGAPDTTVGNKLDTGGSVSLNFNSPSGTGGSVNMANVDIKTGSSSAAGNGGGVNVVGVNGTGSTGSISLHSINTSSTGGIAGSVRMQGGIGGTITVGSPVPVTKVSSAPIVINAIGKTRGGGVTITGVNTGFSAPITFDANGTVTAGGLSLGSSGNLGQKVSINGGISTNATAPAAAGDGGSIVQINVDSDIDIIGQVKTGGFIGGPALQVSMSSKNGDITFHSGVNTSPIPSAKNPNFFSGDVALQTFGAKSNQGDIQIARDLITNNSGGTPGTLTIAAATEIRVGYNLKSLSSVLLSPQGQIDTSSKNGVGGAVNLAAGVGGATIGSIAVGNGINTSGTTGGGSITLDAENTITIGKIGLNSSSSGSGAGGAIVVENGQFVTAGDQVFGIHINGPINSSGFTSGGNVELKGFGGTITVNGGITTTAKDPVIGLGGNIILGSLVFGTDSSRDIQVSGALNASAAEGGDIQVFAGRQGFAVTDAFAARISIGGRVDSHSTGSFSGGNVNIRAQTQINLGSGIDSTGLNGGSIDLNASDGGIFVLGNIKSSAVSQKTVSGGNGGAISINKASLLGQTAQGIGSYVSVKGSISANGGSANGKSISGGKAGPIVILTEHENDSPAANRIGGISITASIEARGGNTLDTLLSGGKGALIELQAGTVQVGGSLNVSGGTNASKSQANSGDIFIETYGNQPIPLSLNLSSTKATEVALPGGVFELGSSKVNGIAGSLIANNIVIGKGNPIVSARLINGPILIRSGESNLLVNMGTVQRQVSSLSSSSLTSITRTLLTPSEALAVYTATHTVGGNPNLLSDGASGEGNTIVVRASEFGPQLSSFNISTGTANRSLVVFRAVVDDLNSTSYVNLPKSGTTPPSGTQVKGAANLIFGELQLDDISGVSFLKEQIWDFGAVPLTIGAVGAGPLPPQFGQITSKGDPNIVGIFLGSGSPTWTNMGYINVDRQVWHVPNGKGLTVVGFENRSLAPQWNFQANNFITIHLGTNELFTGTLSWKNNTNRTYTDVATNSLNMYANTINIGGTSTAFNLEAPNFSTVNFQTVKAVNNINLNGNGIVTFFIGQVAAGNNITMRSDIDLNLQNVSIQSGSNTKLTSDGDIQFQQANVITGTKGLITASQSDTGNKNASLIISAKGKAADGAFGSTFKSVSGNMQIGGVLGGIAFATGFSILDSAGNLNFYSQGISPTPASSGDPPPTSIDINGSVKAGFNLSIGSFPSLGLSDYRGSILVRGDYSAGTGIKIDSLTTVTAPVNNDIIIGIGTVLSTKSGLLSISTTGQTGAVNQPVDGNIFFFDNARLSAGTADLLSPRFTTQPTQTLLPGDIVSAGSISIESYNSINVLGVSTVAPEINFQSFGGDLNMLARGANAGNLNLGDRASYSAQGGNLILLAQNNIVGGASAAGFKGNTFLARGFASKVGGGVEIRSGTTTSNLALAFLATPPGPGLIPIDAVNAPKVNTGALVTPFQVFVGAPPNVNLGTVNGLNDLIGTKSIVIINGSGITSVNLNSSSTSSFTALGNEEQIRGDLDSDADVEIVVDSAEGSDELML